MPVIKRITSQIMALNVVIVAVASNNAQIQDNLEIRSYPAQWAGPEFPVIVTGSLTRNFAVYPTSNYGPQTTVWGIGEDCFVARLDTATVYGIDSGTSFGRPYCYISLRRYCSLSLVASQISGLMACFLSLSTCPFFTGGGAAPANAWEFFARENGTFPRGMFNFRVMWNQLEGLLAPQSNVFRRNYQRDDKEVCRIRSDLLSSTSPSTTSQKVTSSASSFGLSSSTSIGTASSPLASTTTSPLRALSTGTIPPFATPPAPAAPYSQGMCSLHLEQWRYPRMDTGTYDLEDTLYDNSHTQIDNHRAHQRARVILCRSTVFSKIA